MDWLNDYLLTHADEGASLRGLCGTLGQVMMVLAVIFYILRMRPKFVDVLKVLVIAALTYFFMTGTHISLQWYQKFIVGDMNYVPDANLALAFTFLPLLSWLCAKTFNVSTGFAGDVTALTAVGFHVLGRAGCLFKGCCYGFACEWGWYSQGAADDAVRDAIVHGADLPNADPSAYNCFPTSFVESLFTLAILVFIILRICRKGYTPDGKNLPYFLLLYGVCRFFSELTRESTRDLWLFWRISDIHIHMLVMATVGGLMLWWIGKKKRAAAVGEEPSLPVLKGRRK